MAYFGRALRWSLAAVLAGGLLAGCGGEDRTKARQAAAPVRHVAAMLAKDKRWTAGKCLCAGHFGSETTENFPKGMLDEEFARYPFLRNWADCAPYYGRKANLKGCEAGMVDFVCAVMAKPGKTEGTVRVFCHVNGESDALQKAGVLRDEFDVSEDGARVEPRSAKASKVIHE